MGEVLDNQGQPPSAFNAKARAERDLSEMLGLVKGVLADGVVADDEAAALHAWAEDHPDVTSAWPGRILLRRLRRIFGDGVVSGEERDDLKELLEVLVGGRAGLIGGETTATELPFDDPAPIIEIPDRLLVLTGRFAFGPRRACEEATRRIGGWLEPTLTQRTDYLVIGTFASRDWAHTSRAQDREGGSLPEEAWQTRHRVGG